MSSAYHESYSNPRSPISIGTAVMDYWVTTKRRTKGTRILYIVLCECCEVIFPSGRKRKRPILCAVCRPKWSAAKPCPHP